MMEFSAGAARALDMLGNAGYEAVLVGGCVRDLLRGARPQDWDVATAATPPETAAVFADFRVLPTGVRHGTLTVLLEGDAVEITTFRSEEGSADGRHPDRVRFSRSLEEDLSRRDFTINALCLDASGRLTDRFGGRADLADGIIRCIGEPDRRFAEDALRILRALRFAARFSFRIAEQTAESLTKNRQWLARLSAERVFSELTALLCAADSTRVLLAFPQVLGAAVAPFDATVAQFWETDGDPREHAARAVGTIAPEAALRWTMLLSRVGNAAVAADRLLDGLNAPRVLRERVVALLQRQALPLSADRDRLRRQLAQEGEPLLRDLLRVQRADAQARRPLPASASDRLAALDRSERALDALLAEPNAAYRVSDLAIGGRELLALGIPEGPCVGDTLRRLLEAVLARRCPNERDSLLALARSADGGKGEPS